MGIAMAVIAGLSALAAIGSAVVAYLQRKDAQKAAGDAAVDAAAAAESARLVAEAQQRQATVAESSHESEIRRQANQVTVSMSAWGGWAANIENGSHDPLYDVELVGVKRLDPGDDSAPQEIDWQVNPRARGARAYRQVLEGTTTHSIPFESADVPFDLAVVGNVAFVFVVEFRDSNGRRWRRDETGLTLLD